MILLGLSLREPPHHLKDGIGLEAVKEISHELLWIAPLKHFLHPEKVDRCKQIYKSADQIVYQTFKSLLSLLIC